MPGATPTRQLALPAALQDKNRAVPTKGPPFFVRNAHPVPHLTRTETFLNKLTRLTLRPLFAGGEMSRPCITKMHGMPAIQTRMTSKWREWASPDRMKQVVSN